MSDFLHAHPTRLPWRHRLHQRIWLTWHHTRHRIGTRIAGIDHGSDGP